MKKHVKAKHPESNLNETDSPTKLQSTVVTEVKLEIPAEDIKVEEDPNVENLNGEDP